MGEGFLLLAIGVFAGAAWTWQRVVRDPTDESRRAMGLALLIGPWALTAFFVGAALLEARFGYPGD